MFRSRDKISTELDARRGPGSTCTPGWDWLLLSESALMVSPVGRVDRFSN